MGFSHMILPIDYLERDDREGALGIS
ncbi:hypothetical protein MY4824_003831 [Beauveria thailandica]